jgi:biopolymer transport protein ExbB
MRLPLHEAGADRMLFNAQQDTGMMDDQVQGCETAKRSAVFEVAFRGLSGLAFVAVLALGGATFAQEAGPTPVSSTDLSEPAPEVAPANAPLTRTADAEQSSSGIPTSPVEIIERLNYWLAPFVIASVISVWFAIERIVVLRRKRVIPPKFVQPFLEKLKKGELTASAALILCEKSDSPIAAVFEHGIRKWGYPSFEVEQAIIDGGERQIGQLRRHLKVLNGIATVTPLLGLLGTVVGMIEAFNEIASAAAMGKADQLAAGIAMALLTTAIGLAIAIPSLIMYMYLSGRVESLVLEMDDLSMQVVRAISAEGLGNRPSGTSVAGRSRVGKTPEAKT